MIDFATLQRNALAAVSDDTTDLVELRAQMQFVIRRETIALWTAGMCGHRTCLEAAVGTIFHATLILAELDAIDLLDLTERAVNAGLVLADVSTILAAAGDAVAHSPADTVPPDGDAVRPPSASPPPGDADGVDLTPPYGIERPPLGVMPDLTDRFQQRPPR